jgi:hypothetical protein
VAQNTHVDEVDHFGLGCSVIELARRSNLGPFESYGHGGEVCLSRSVIGEFQVGNDGVVIVSGGEGVNIFVGGGDICKGVLGVDAVISRGTILIDLHVVGPGEIGAFTRAFGRGECSEGGRHSK